MVNGLKVKKMVLGSIGKMEIFMKVNGRTIKKMAKVSSLSRILQYTMVNELIITNVVMDSNFIE